MRHGERNYWGNYFLRRVLRIYPLFTVALLLHLLLTRLGITTVIGTWQDVAAHLRHAGGQGRVLVDPGRDDVLPRSPVILLICGLVLRWRPGVVFAFLAGLVAAAAWLSASGWLPPGSLVDYLPIFLMGAIIAVHEVLVPRQDQRGGLALDVAALVATAIILATIPAVSTALFGFRFRLNSIWRCGWWPRPAGPCCCLPPPAARPWSGRCSSGRRLRFLGMISFSATCSLSDHHPHRRAPDPNASEVPAVHAPDPGLQRPHVPVHREAARPGSGCPIAGARGAIAMPWTISRTFAPKRTTPW